MIKIPKPYTCMKCGSIFVALTFANQCTCFDACPVCQRNEGNIRTDKSLLEISREGIAPIGVLKQHSETLEA